MQRKKADEMQRLKEQLEQAQRDLKQSNAEKVRLQDEANTLKASLVELTDKRAEDALRNLIVLGKLKQARRERGQASSESGDSAFASPASKQDEVESDAYSSDESEGCESEDRCDRESDTLSEVSPALLFFQEQVHAADAVLSHENLVGRRDDNNLIKFQNLLARAREVCAFFADQDALRLRNGRKFCSAHWL